MKRTISLLLILAAVLTAVMAALVAQVNPQPNGTDSDTVVMHTEYQNMEPEVPNPLVTTVYTDIQLTVKGYGIGTVVYSCPPGHTPKTGGCMSVPTNLTGCLTDTVHIVRRFDNVVCDGLPHTFPTDTYWIAAADGIPHIGPDWQAVWAGATFCLGQQYTVRTRDRITHPACSASPTPVPRPTPYPTPTPTPSPTPTPLPPSPTPIECAPGTHYCAPVWYYGGSECGWYWTRPICCPDGYRCQIHFLWFTCYNMGCCDDNGCIVNGVEVSAFDIMKAEMMQKQ